MGEWRIKLKQYSYYILIAVLSLLSLIILPMLGSNVSISEAFPTSTLGWIIYIVNRIAIIIINMLIFANFVSQGKLNICDDPKYKEAVNILALNKPKDYTPRSPKEYLGKTYTKKGGSLVLGSILALFSIGTSVLTYDYMILISTLFTIVVAIVCGVMTMKQVEIYYTTEFYDYAKFVEEKNKNDNN